MQKITQLVDDTLKKFVFLYKNSPIFEMAIKSVQDILEEVYIHKIQKVYVYQEQIKPSQLLLGAEDQDGGQHQESLQFYLDDLMKERENYLNLIEEKLNKTEGNIKEACLQYNIKDNNDFQKVKYDFLSNLAQISTI